VVLILERAPNANAHAERFVRSIKDECLDRIIPMGEYHFRRAVAEYVEHYHRERNHQGLDNRLIADTPTNDRTGRAAPDRGWPVCSISTCGRRDVASFERWNITVFAMWRPTPTNRRHPFGTGGSPARGMGTAGACGR
jgi:Integrase core domain